MSLTNKESRFVSEYMIDFNGTRSAIAAGYSSVSAATCAWDLLRNPEIAEEIARRKAIATAKIDLKVEDVVKSISSVLRADPRELVQTHTGACRYCYGTLNMYQFRPQEFRDAYDAHLAKHGTQKPFDPKGGSGYSTKREPNPDCPECDGRGRDYIVVTPSDQLSADAAQLYMGIKKNSSGGIEILMRSKDKAAEQCAKYLGMDSKTIALVDQPPSGLEHFYGRTKPTEPESGT